MKLTGTATWTQLNKTKPACLAQHSLNELKNDVRLWLRWCYVHVRKLITWNAQRKCKFYKSTQRGTGSNILLIKRKTQVCPRFKTCVWSCWEYSSSGTPYSLHDVFPSSSLCAWTHKWLFCNRMVMLMPSFWKCMIEYFVNLLISTHICSTHLKYNVVFSISFLIYYQFYFQIELGDKIFLRFLSHHSQNRGCSFVTLLHCQTNDTDSGVWQRNIIT